MGGKQKIRDLGLGTPRLLSGSGGEVPEEGGQIHMQGHPATALHDRSRASLKDTVGANTVLPGPGCCNLKLFVPSNHFGGMPPIGRSTSALSAASLPSMERRSRQD